MYCIKVFEIDLTKDKDKEVNCSVYGYKTKKIATAIARRYNKLFNDSHRIAVARRV